MDLKPHSYIHSLHNMGARIAISVFVASLS